jgi:hypothetical protein
MKKNNLNIIITGLVLSLSTLSCSEKKSKTEDQNVIKNTEAKTEIDTISETPKIASMTKSESIDKLKQFLKKNSKKYNDYGEIEEIKSTGGDYNGDGVLDFIYTVNFYPGGDYIHPSNFYYDSKKGEFSELTLSTPLKILNNINANEIKEGKISGTAELFSAFDGEHSAIRSVNAEFTVKDSKIFCDKSFLPKFKKAEKSIQKELDQLQQDLFDNADAYNSDAEAEAE